MKLKIIYVIASVAVLGVCGLGILVKGNVENKAQVSNVLITSKMNMLKQEGNVSTEKLTSSIDDKIIDVQTHVDLIKSYRDVNELRMAAQIIVTGDVLSLKSYMSDMAIITEYKIKVTEAYKNANVGDILTLVSAGGIIPYDEYMSKTVDKAENIKNFEIKEPKAKLSLYKIRTTMGKNQIIEVGKKYTIFANEQNVIDENGKQTLKYCTVGVDQGQFNNEKDGSVNNISLNYKDNINQFKKEILRK